MNYYNPYQQMYSQPMPDQLAQYRQQYQMQTYQQPQQPVQQAQQQSAMVWVRNRAEADNYPVAPNTAIALWDMSGPYVHRKETDVSGRPVVKTFQIVEVADVLPQTIDQQNFVTREEFAAFVNSLKQQPGKYATKEDAVNEQPIL